MIKSKLVLFFLFFVIFGCSSLKITQTKIKNQISLTETERIVSVLASDSLQGRYPFSETYEKSMSFVENFMKSNKIKPFYKETYRDVLIQGSKSANIVGLIGDYDRNKEHIIIGAHLDHLGVSEDTSQRDTIFNGANDNATGVTAVLLVAKELAKHTFDKNVIVAIFTEEELGLVGANHLANRLKKEKVNVSYVLNYEMIGVPMLIGEDKVYVTGYKKSNLAQEMNKVAGKEFVVYLPEDNMYGLFEAADNFPFYQVLNIPSHTISSYDIKNYDHYHKLSDEINNLNIKHLNNIIQNSVDIIYRMLKNNVKIQLYDSIER